MRRYLLQSIVASTLLLAAVVAVNVLVDPYRVWELPGGLSEGYPRPRATQHLALVKARGIERTRPNTIVLGNSRAEIGFDPESRQWPLAMRPVYNAAVAGAGPDLAVRLLQQALSAGAVRHIVVGLDFMDFLGDSTRGVIPEDWRPIAKPMEGRLQRMRNDFLFTFSLDALEDSAVTLVRRNDPDAADVTQQGFNPLREYPSFARLEGYGALFAQRDMENARAYANAPKAIYAPGSSTSNAWRDLDRLLQLVQTYRIQATFVIYPYHSHVLEMLHAAGLSPLFDEWKRRLAAGIASDNSDDPKNCRLWDFSGYHAYAMERVPRLDDRKTRVKWYWEAGHFKSRLGDLMIHQMFGEPSQSFGTCVSTLNVAEDVERFHRRREAYLRVAPHEAEEIAKLVRSAVPR